MNGICRRDCIYGGRLMRVAYIKSRGVLGMWHGEGVWDIAFNVG